MGCQPGIVIKIIIVARRRATVVGDQDVNTSKTAQSLVGHVPDLGIIRQVSTHRQYFRACLLGYLVSGGPKSCTVTSTDDHIGPFVRQFHGTCLAQPSARCDNDSNTLPQSQVHLALLWFPHLSVSPDLAEPVLRT